MRSFDQVLWLPVVQSLSCVQLFVTPCQLQTGTYQEHCQGLPASTESEPHAPTSVDLQQPLRDFRVVLGTLCSRESGGTGL